MLKIKKLLVTGIPFQLEQIGLEYPDAMIIARGNSALNWLKNQDLVPDAVFALAADQTVDQWVELTLASHNTEKTLVYVTSSADLHTDQVALHLIQLTHDAEVQLHPGETEKRDFFTWMKTGQALLSLDGILLRQRHHPPFSADQNVLIVEPAECGSLPDLFTLLTRVYPPNQSIAVNWDAGLDQPVWQTDSVEAVKIWPQAPAAIFIPAISADASLASFQEIIAHLRAPEDGCPWDKKQTHSSLRAYLLEETYEALDALDKGDLNDLKEELGDILLQILLHAQIAQEAGEFNLADVISGIHRKIVHRHPHVFKDWQVNGEQDVIQNWETIKGQERQENGREDKKGMLDGVPLSSPSLAQAQSIQERAARVGFDWPELAPVMEKVIEELQEVKDAPDAHEREKEIGDLLFAMVNLIRWYKVDAETALRQTNLKFRKRFAYIEDQARLAGKDLKSMTLQEMDVFWEQAKQFDL